MKNFNRNTLRAAAAITLAALAVGSYAATSANNTANAEVVAPLGIAAGTSLHFGTIAGGDLAGTVVVSAAGARSATGGTQILAGLTHTAATFNVTGAAGKTYVVTLPSSAVTLTGQTDDTKTMSAGTFTYAAASGGTPTIQAGGTDTISVGATLSVGASQASQVYQGTFTVSVAYN